MTYITLKKNLQNSQIVNKKIVPIVLRLTNGMRLVLINYFKS
jgi:hypothetical protein